MSTQTPALAKNPLNVISTQKTHDANGNLLPAILCLHGGGSNATVFKIQTRRLIWALSSQFRFVFAQATTEGQPGTDMIPVFKDCAPFYRWASRKFVAGEGEVEITPAEEVEAIDENLRTVMRENGGEESFVGVLGFSQGARLTAGLLLRQVMEHRAGKESWTKFKFGVIMAGPYPPIGMSDGDTGLEIKPEDYQLLTTIPTVHAWGRNDPLKAGCQRLADVCESDVSFQMDYEGTHHLPLKDGDARDLCDLIMAAWYAGGGQRTVGAGEKY